MKNIKYVFSLIVLLLNQFAWSADTGGSAPALDPEMTQAGQLITKKDWAGALVVLERYTRANPGSADGFNLQGYSLRHLKRYDDALVAYKQALKLDPSHRGAHEYIGEAYIQMGQMAKAKEHLDALDKICFFSCEEFRDLKKAYEAALKAKAN